MKLNLSNHPKILIFTLTLMAVQCALSAPTITRLTPPSELFSNGRAAPVIARFLPGQRFDLQATVRPDSSEKEIISAYFSVDGRKISDPTAMKRCNDICLKDLPANATLTTVRAFSIEEPGFHTLQIHATQSDGLTVSAQGNFEIVALTKGGKKIKNIVIMLGDGMGAAQRTAARIVAGGYAQGKVINPLAMDSFPVTGIVKTASLNSIVTDSSPGMTAYVSGNKNNNNAEGVFPDDTLDPFDNPRIEYLSEYLHRTQGKTLGLVTTADVFDATPAGNAVHTSNRGAGTGIVDQYLDDKHLTGLSVLMGGGRKWFLPSTTPGSARSERTDYAFSELDAHTNDIVKRWGASRGHLDKDRNLLEDFQKAGFIYAADKSALDAIDLSKTDRLLGLFALSNMNVSLDKIDGRRAKALGQKGRVVDDYGFPDQPMLDEMTSKALAILDRHNKGFVLMVEGASIDKQAHAMDTERWLLDTIEFDRAVSVAKAYAQNRSDTLVIVTADHECAGVALIGGSRVSDTRLQTLVREGNGHALRNEVVGIYEQAGFPKYLIENDGYPQTTDIDNRMLVGYGSNADRMEDYRTNPLPLQDSQQPFVKLEPLSTYPSGPLARDQESKYFIQGQVPGDSATHTATDIPLSAFGPGAYAFTGVIDNTDVFFKLAQASIRGILIPEQFPTMKHRSNRKH